MSSENTNSIEKFDEIVLVKVNPKNSTLPIDVVAEWSKGFGLVNTLIKELAQERYKDYIEDSKGNIHEITKMNPLVIQLMKERRALEDQFWKFIGGDAINEVKKESMKEIAKSLFEFNTDNKLKQQFKEEAKKILEAEFDEENSSSS